MTTTAAAAAAAAPPAIEEPSAGPADRDRDAFSRPLPPPPATQRPAAPSTSKKYLTPAGSASSLSDLSSATGGTPAASNALLLSPATPKAMADFAESHVPQLTLVEDRFFTYDELMELDLSSLAGFTTPAQTDMIAVADKSNRFRQDTDDWTAKVGTRIHGAGHDYSADSCFNQAGIATTGRDVDALATRALWLGNNTNRAAREAMQDNWAKEVTVIHLFLGQFCVKYADNWHAARGGDRPTCADFTLLKRLGLSDANATIYQNLSRSVMAGGISTTGLTYLKKAGGVTFNHCLHFLLMRFPRIVLGQPRNRHVLVEDRADHLYTSPGWQPLREAFERVFLQGFSFGYLSEGLLPKDGYDNIFIKWGNLPESDFVIIKAMVEKEVSLTWVAERSLEDFIKGVRAEDGDFKAVRSHWLDRLRRKVMEEVEERVEKAIKSDDRDQLSEWATAHNSSLFVEAATSERIQFHDAWSPHDSGSWFLPFLASLSVPTLLSTYKPLHSYEICTTFMKVPTLPVACHISTSLLMDTSFVSRQQLPTVRTSSPLSTTNSTALSISRCLRQLPLASHLQYRMAMYDRKLVTRTLLPYQPAEVNTPAPRPIKDCWILISLVSSVT